MILLGRELCNSSTECAKLLILKRDKDWTKIESKEKPLHPDIGCRGVLFAAHVIVLGREHSKRYDIANWSWELNDHPSFIINYSIPVFGLDNTLVVSRRYTPNGQHKQDVAKCDFSENKFKSIVNLGVYSNDV